MYQSTWFNGKYFQVFGCILKNTSKNTFKYLIAFQKILWKTNDDGDRQKQMVAEAKS